MFSLKNIFLISALILILGLFLIPVVNAGNEYTEEAIETKEVTGIQKIEIETASDDISVVSTEEPLFEIKAVKRVKASSEEEAKEIFKELQMEIVKENDLLKVSTKHPKISSSNSIDLFVKVPQGLFVNVKSASGDVSAENLNGELEIKSASGDIELLHCQGTMDIKAASGDISIRESQGKIICACASGDAILEKVAGKVEVACKSGDIMIKESSAALDVKTSSGNLSAQFFLDTGMDSSISSASGDININLSPDSKCQVDVSTLSGSIIISDLSLDVEKKTEKTLKATLNGGGAKLNLQTLSGDVNIEKGKSSAVPPDKI